MGLFFFPLLVYPTSFLSNVEENGLFCIVVLNIVFLLTGQLDCKLHATIDWKKNEPCQSLPSVSSTQQLIAHITTTTNACECIFLLAGFTCDVSVLLRVRFVSCCMKDWGVGWE